MKKAKIVLTPEQRALRKVARKETLKLGFRDGIVPFLIILGICVVCIFEFVFLIANDAFAHVPGVPDLMVGGHAINDPNWLRLVYLLVAIPGVFVLLAWASKIAGKKKSFFVALIAGILAWQALGECSWHFGLTVEGTFLFFPIIEGVQGTFLLVLFASLVIYLAVTKRLPWYMLVFLLTFLSHWVGHWIILGIAPWFPVGASYFNPGKWPKLVGILVGLHGSIMLVYRILFKAKTLEERLLLALALYTAVGVVVEGVFGVGASLE